MYSSTFSTILPWFFGRVWRRRNEIDLQPSSIAKERTSEVIVYNPYTRSWHKLTQGQPYTPLYIGILWYKYSPQLFVLQILQTK